MVCLDLILILQRMKPSNYEMSDEGNESDKATIINQEGEGGKQHNHIQIQMIYPPGSSMGYWLRKQIASMSEILEYNNKAILILIEKSQALEANLSFIEKIIKERKVNQSNRAEQMNHSQTWQYSEYSKILLEKLYGQRTYKYSLTLADPLPKTLYKQRNFTINVRLVDLQGNLIINTNRVPISLCSYTSDQEPQSLLENKVGKHIFKGNYETQLAMGVGSYHKIQFREVTSYYKNGWVHFVICPKPLPFSYRAKDSPYEMHIDWQLIRPLVLSEIVVKAKKKL